MCFSAAASFVAAGSLGGVSVATLRRAGATSQRPLAAIPLLFGIQQAVEGVVWLSFATPWLNAVSTYAYVGFSHLLWPMFLPYAVWRAETGPRRRKILQWFAWAGAAVSLYIGAFVLRGRVASSILGHGIGYEVTLPNYAVIPGAYVLVTCGSCLFSSHKFVRVFGMALLASLIVAYWYYSQAFASVWCFFAAILSLIVYVHLGQKPPAGRDA